MNPIVPLQQEIHGRVGINDQNFIHVQDQHLIPIVFHEFIQVSQEFPIVFVKNALTGHYQAVCVVGIESGNNLFATESHWGAKYLPLSVRNAPFCLIPEGQESDRMLIGINETSARVLINGGEKLFSESGQETAYLCARKSALIDYFEKEQVSELLTQVLVGKGLLSPQTLNLNLAGNALSLNGIYIVDESKLNSLSNEDFLDLRDKGLLPSIYAHLLSGQRWSDLANLHTSTK